MVTFFLLIVFFTYFYVSITFNPKDVADNMKKYGGLNSRPAEHPTEKYLDYVLTRLTAPGSVYLGLVALIPLVAFVLVDANANFPFSGTSILIMVGVGRRPCSKSRANYSSATTRIPAVRRLLLMGPPGSGKGTQAHLRRAAGRFGDLHRRHLSRQRRRQDPLGIEAKKYIAQGEYVPDSVTNAMVRSRLSRPDAATGFILDGYPRTVSQVEFLDDVLAEQGTKLDAVIALVVDVEEVVRLLRRADAEGRSDDTEDVIRHRLKLFAEQTAPLAEIYEGRGLLTRVYGVGPVAEVAARMLAVVTNGDDVSPISPETPPRAHDPAQIRPRGRENASRWTGRGRGARRRPGCRRSRRNTARIGCGRR